MLQLKHVDVVEVFRALQTTLSSQQQRLGFLLAA